MSGKDKGRTRHGNDTKRQERGENKGDARRGNGNDNKGKEQTRTEVERP